MKKTALVYGTIAGLIAIGGILAGFALSEGQGFLTSAWLGYLVMIVALSLIFVGIKRYRDIELGGIIRFGRAFAMGVGIAAVAGIAYVLVWEAYLASTDYAFIEDYTAGIIEAKQEAGASEVVMKEEIAKMEELKSQYANPLFRLPMTFLEIFPVAFLIALISATVLRNPNVLPARE